MATEPSFKSKAWALFDRIVELRAPKGAHTNPWKRQPDGTLRYEPDYDALCKLLGVPLWLGANTRSGVPALALDVWLSYELRRAGFGSDQTWPRPKHPRILPASVARLLEELKDKAGPIRDFIEREGAVKGVTKSSATILGKNYWKQVDVIVTDYDSGPELLISTKRMDSSYGKNAPNRVEESYGDAKNLRLRHPLAAMGFVFGLRSDILQKEPATADWLFDLLVKLGREDDAYHSTALILMEYAGGGFIEDGLKPDQAVVQGRDGDADAVDDEVPAVLDEADQAIGELPEVKILLSETPPLLDPSRFLAAMVERVLRAANKTA